MEKIILREEYLKQFEDIIAGDVSGVLIGDTEAIYGSGKSTLINLITQHVSESDAFFPIKIGLQEYSYFFTNQLIDDPKEDLAVKQNYHDYRKLIIDICKDVSSLLDNDFLDNIEDHIKLIEFNLIKEHLESLNLKEILTGNRFKTISSYIDDSIEGGAISIDGYTEIVNSSIQTEKNYTYDIRLELENSISQEVIFKTVSGINSFLVSKLNGVKKNKKVLLLADDFCWVIDQHIGNWFFSLVSKLDQTTVVLFRTVTESAFLSPLQNVKSLQLKPFSKVEVLQYLDLNLFAKVDATNVDRADLVDNIHDFTGGHPLLVSLLGNAVRQSLDNDSFDVLFGHLTGKATPDDGDDLPPLDTVDTVNDLNQRILRVLEEFEKKDIAWRDYIIDSFILLAVSRRLTYDQIDFIVRHVYAVDEDEKVVLRTTDRIISCFQRFSFIEEKMIKRVGVKQKIRTWSVHHSVRDCMLDKYTSEYPRKVQNVHRALADYFASKELDRLDENLKLKISNTESVEYKDLYRLESKDWQFDIEEWLYHVFHVQDRSVARYSFAKVFMQAFDWYDYFIPFEFCDRLIHLWKRTQPPSDWITIFETLRKCYPKRFDKKRSDAVKEVTQKLFRLIQSTGLNRVNSSASPDRRNTLGIIYKYLADSYRLRTLPEIRKAESFYLKAIGLFTHDWYKLWAQSDLARLYFEDNRYVEATEQLKLSQDCVMDDGLQSEDHEVISQNLILYAEIHAASKDFRRFNEYIIECIKHLYLFPFDNNIDIYTISWWNDLTTYAVELIERSYKEFNDSRVLYQSIKDIWIGSGADIAPFLSPLFLEDTTGLSIDSIKSYILPVMPNFRSKDVDTEPYLESVFYVRNNLNLDI